MPDQKMRAETGARKPTDPTMVQLEAMIAAWEAARNALDAGDDEADDRFHAAQRALYAARPSDPSAMAAQLRWMLGEIKPNNGYDDGATDLDLLAHVADRLEVAPIARYSGLEDAARKVCAGYAVLDGYDAELAPTSSPPTQDEFDRYTTRLGFLIEGLGPHVRDLAKAVWGDARLVDDIYPCREPEAEQEPTGDRADLWAEFKAAEAAIDAATPDDGPLPQDDPLWARYHAARDAIVNGRPNDLAGLAVQLRFFQDVLAGSAPNDDEEEMLAHVTDQLATLAGDAS